MKKFKLWLTLLLVTLLITQVNAYNSKGNWRWRNDDGNEATASWKQDENTVTTLTNEENIRLRVEVYYQDVSNPNSSAPTLVDIGLAYKEVGTSDWINITNDSSTNAFVINSSANVSDLITTSNQLTNNYSYYQSGKVFTNTYHSVQELLTNTSSTELEFCIKPTSKIKYNTTYNFTPVRWIDDSNNDPFDSKSVTIQLITPNIIPTVSTNVVSSIDSYSATLGGEVTSDNGYSVTERGIVYSTSGTPTTSDTKVQMGNGTGTFSESVNGLSPNTTYYARAYATNSKGTSYGNEVTFTTTTIIWDGTSWYPASPIATDNIVLNGNYNDVGFTCNNISVNAGNQFTIASGTMLVDGNLTLKSDAANGTATLINNGTLSVGGTANVEQYLSSGRNWYITSPVTNATTNALSTASSVARYYEPTTSWLTLNSGDPLVPGVGYISVNTTSTGTINFTGTLNDGSLTNNLTRTAEASKSGFNLVGNPYPSYLDWTLVSAENEGVSTTMWYRGKSAANAYVFDTFNAIAGIGTALGETTNTKFIPPMQAFWVKVIPDSTEAVFRLKNSMRAHRDVAGNKFKAPAVNENQIVRLQVTNQINKDETVLYFNSKASNYLDAYDSPKMLNNNPLIPEIYTLIADEKIAINGMSSIPLNQEIPIGFIPGQNGSFSITANEMTNFAAEVHLVLKDNVENTEYDLTDGTAYNFASNEFSTATRFGVIFKTIGITTITEKSMYNKNYAYCEKIGNVTVVCNIKMQPNASLNIYNTVGQVIVSKNLGSTITKLNNLLPGIYIVVISDGNESVTQKVTVR